jgi:uncharacterized membrane protein (UPF0127 family)
MPIRFLLLLLTASLALGMSGCGDGSPSVNRVVFETRNPPGEVVVRVEVAQTRAQQRRGLMFREHLDEDAGMLFVFPRETTLTFWMKNTRIPLDLIALSNRGKVVSVVANVQPCVARPCPTYPTKRDASYMVEVNAGFAKRHGIAEGDKVSIQLKTP